MLDLNQSILSPFELILLRLINMTFSQLTYPQMLDLVMRKYTSELANELHLSQSQSDSFANTIANDINGLDAAHKQVVRAALSPLTIADIASQHYTIDGVRLLAQYVDQFEETFGDGRKSGPAIIASAQLNLENYFCFVYLKDSLFEAIRSNLDKTHNSSALFRACQLLLKDEVRILRNAFSHAACVVDTSSNPNSLKYWELTKNGDIKDMSKPLFMPDDRWSFLRNLAYTVSFVAIKNL